MKPYDLIALPNNQIMSLDYLEKSLTIYDQNLKLVKRIDRIGGGLFAPLAIFINLEEEIFYIADNQNNRILMTDFDFNLIKSIGSRGKENDQFNGLYDLCLINQSLVVCDYENQRLQVYSKDLEFEKSINTFCEPFKIKTTSSLICIHSVGGIFFYYIDSFKLFKWFNHNFCKISKINSNIYELDHRAKKLFCYDEKSNDFMQELTYSNEYLSVIWDGSMIVFNGTLLITSYTKNKIIKYSMQ